MPNVAEIVDLLEREEALRLGESPWETYNEEEEDAQGFTPPAGRGNTVARARAEGPGSEEVLVPKEEFGPKVDASKVETRLQRALTAGLERSWPDPLPVRGDARERERIS